MHNTKKHDSYSKNILQEELEDIFALCISTHSVYVIQIVIII